jgi:hypothetical protein
LLAHGRWFFPGTAASSTTKTGHHDKAEILLKLVLKHQKSINQSNLTVCLLDMICKYIVYHTTNLLMQNKQRRDEYVKGKETYYFVDIMVGNSYYKPISTV